MLANSHRDEQTMPIVREALAPFRAFLEAVRDILMDGRPLRGKARTRVQAAIGHALAFPTWRSLAREQNLDDAAAADLMIRFVSAARQS